MAKTTTKDTNFAKRQETLAQRLIDLNAEFRALMDDIKADGQFYKGFRSIKETYFRLDKIARRNGYTPDRAVKPGTANNAIFQRRPQDAFDEAGRRTAKAPPATNVNNAIFEKLAPGERKTAKTPATARPTNTNVNSDLFVKKVAPTPPPKEVRKAKEVKRDPKAKILATSEDENDD